MKAALKNNHELKWIRRLGVVLVILVPFMLGLGLAILFVRVDQIGDRLVVQIARDDANASLVRAANRCALHDIVEGERTILVAIRGLLVPGPNATPQQRAQLKLLIDAFDAQLNALHPVSINGLDCTNPPLPPS